MTAQITGTRRPILAALVVGLLLALSGPVSAGASTSAAAAPSDPITLEVVTVNGSGCPAGTATVTALPNNTGFRVTYRNFIAEAGGAVRPVDFRKNCQINLLVHIPQGFTFAIASAEYRGRARLQEGASGLQRTNYYFQGSSDNNFVDHTFAGPLSSAWRTVDETPVTELVFAPCGEFRNLNLNTELRVDEGTVYPTRVSSLSMRSTDGEIDTLIRFQWKEC